ncbi:MAG: hypothetical protein JNM62_08620 [Flavobacteriales bacterium]|nr:hypothetical protein [Flavobacteriales bacterium]
MPAPPRWLGNIRGALLEEVVLHLLQRVGYRTVKPGEEGTRNSGAGLLLLGRGTEHQIDALAAYDHGPAFVYPIRVLVEAKCYFPPTKVELPIVRNSVGVLKDVSENYVSHAVGAPAMSRFNYVSAIFSNTGFTTRTQHYAIAHQVFLIQYHRKSLLSKSIKGLLDLAAGHFHFDPTQPLPEGSINRVRMVFRGLLSRDLALIGDVPVLTEAGFRHLEQNVIGQLQQIRGSYYGSLQGIWPVHLLSSTEIPQEAFADRDTLRCRISQRNDGQWFFAPSQNTTVPHFELEFDLPTEIGRMVAAVENDPLRLAQVKAEQFSFIDLTGIVGGVRRQVRLKLDRDWLNEYLRSKGFENGLDTEPPRPE